MQQEIQVFATRCIGCKACFEQCLQGAHVAQNGSHQFRRELCQACGRCVETCYAESLVMAGKWWTVEELIEELLRDQPFYEQSGGGITLSGGEPLLQQAFSLRVLQECKRVGLNTAIETAAICPWADLEELLPWLDLVMMDIKVMDDEQHRAVTGASNRRILENARRLAQKDMPLLIRTPVIPTVNDSPAAIAAIAEFIRDFPNLLYYELMPFHRLAEGKYRSLGLSYQASDLEPPSKDAVQALAECARNGGVANVKVG